MTTIYTVEIIEFQKAGQWYCDKVGEQFQVELSTKFYHFETGGIRATFKVDNIRSIDPNHCKIISEIKVK